MHFLVYFMSTLIVAQALPLQLGYGYNQGALASGAYGPLGGYNAMPGTIAQTNLATLGGSPQLGLGNPLGLVNPLGGIASPLGVPGAVAESISASVNGQLSGALPRNVYG